ncbi:MAG: ABC transporter permease subunit, partial [Dehalococcoidia bacterium]
TEIYSLLASFPPRFEVVSAFALVFLFFSAVLVYLQKKVMGKRSFTTVVGRGIRPTQIDIGRLRWPLFAFCFAIVGGALFVPALVIFVISFLETWGFWLRPGNFTFDNYAQIFLRMGETQEAFKNTLIIGILAAIFCVLLGLMIAYLITKSKLPGRNALRYASFLPTSIPGVVFTVGVILAFISPPIAIYGTLAIIVVTYVARFLPFSVQPLSNSLDQIDDSLLEGSRVSGAGWFGTMRFITLPLLKYGIFSSLVLIFMSSIREMVSAILLYSQGTQTVLVKIWQFWEEGQTELATALAGVLMIVIAVLYGFVNRFMRERV